MTVTFPERKPKATLTWGNMAVNPISFAVLLEKNRKKPSLLGSYRFQKIVVTTESLAAELPLH